MMPYGSHTNLLIVYNRTLEETMKRIKGSKGESTWGQTLRSLFGKFSAKKEQPMSVNPARLETVCQAEG